MESARLEALGARYTAAWCSQDAGNVAGFYSESGSLQINNGPPAVGRREITAVAKGFMTALPDMVVTMDGVELQGDRAVYRWTLTGTNTGPGGSGRAVRISGYEEWRLGGDDLISDSRGHFDEADYQRQLDAEWTPIARQDFTSNLFKLLKETFEGPPREGGSAYLDKGAGLFQTLDDMTPEVASRSPVPGAPTIAAHCAHVGYYVCVLHNAVVGCEQQIDWASSWRVQVVGTDEWERLKGELRSSYRNLVLVLESIDTWDDDPVGDSMAIVVHTAYHLGAIRQLARMLSA